MSVPCFGLKPNWLSVVAKSGEMHDNMYNFEILTINQPKTFRI